MAEIVKARPRAGPPDAYVAVKRILPHLTTDKQYVAMFLDESRVLARLDHPGIVRTLEVGQVEQTPFIALEYVFGQDARALLQRARRGHPTPIPIACYVIGRVCEALQYAHDARDESGSALGLVHRDVSLQNVLLSYAGEVKLTDFGIARGAHSTARTEAGIVKGNLGYMSPEQLQGHALDRRSDVFAAGVCLYELLTGERLFGGANDYATITKLRQGVVVPPSRINHDISPELEAVVMRALCRRPVDRFASAAELHAALLALPAGDAPPCSASDLGAHLRKVFDDVLLHPIAAGAAGVDAPEGSASPTGPQPSSPGSELNPSEPPWSERSASDVFVRARARSEPASYGGIPSVPVPPAADGVPAANSGAGSGAFSRTADSRVQRVTPLPRRDPDPASDGDATASYFAPPSEPPPAPVALSRTAPIDYGAVIAAVAAIIAVIVVALYVHSLYRPAEIRVRVSPADAELWIDGAAVPHAAPLVARELEPWVSHTIEVKKTGYGSWKTQLTLKSKQRLDMPPVILTAHPPP